MFELRELRVGRGAVMRSHTRLLSGASMEPFSFMLENTLVVSGDVLTAGTVWQGWPARMIGLNLGGHDAEGDQESAVMVGEGMSGDWRCGLAAIPESADEWRIKIDVCWPHLFVDMCVFCLR